MRELEVKLDGSTLPFSSESVLNLQVNLRTVECTVSLIDFKAALSILVGQNLL